MTPGEALEYLRLLARAADDARERYGRGEDAGDIEEMDAANAELADVAVGFADTFPLLDGYLRVFR